MMSCKRHPLCKQLYRNSGHARLNGFYRAYLGKRQGQEVWVIDGALVVSKLYPAFIMGGNDQRYRFNPVDEVWLDNRSGIEEFRYTLAHELIERMLMRQRGWSYSRAHGEGIKLEKEMRDRDELLALKHERKVRASGFVLPGGIYRQFLGNRKGLQVWIVDGPIVRRELHGDFSMGGNGLSDSFIPENEIWLDSAMNLEQVHYTLLQELEERKHMSKGKGYGEAYELGLVVLLDEMERQEKLARAHEKKLRPVRYGTRERGVKTRKRR
jgi:hypothetical protein